MALSSHFPHTPLRTCSPGSPMSDGPSFFPQPLIYSHTLSPTTFPSIYINRQILQSELPLRGTLDAWHSENVERHSGKNQILSVTSYYVALSVSFILSKVVFSAAKTKQPKPQNQTQTKRPQAENPGRTVLGSKQEKLAQLWDSNKNQLWERLLSERSAPTTGGGGGLPEVTWSQGRRGWRGVIRQVAPSVPYLSAPPGVPAAALAQRAPLLERLPSSPLERFQRRGCGRERGVAAQREEWRAGGLQGLRIAGPQNTGWAGDGERRRSRHGPAFPACAGWALCHDPGCSWFPWLPGQTPLQQTNICPPLHFSATLASANILSTFNFYTV